MHIYIGLGLGLGLALGLGLGLGLGLALGLGLGYTHPGCQVLGFIAFTLTRNEKPRRLKMISSLCSLSTLICL